MHAYAGMGCIRMHARYLVGVVFAEAADEPLDLCVAERGQRVPADALTLRPRAAHKQLGLRVAPQRAAEVPVGEQV